MIDYSAPWRDERWMQLSQLLLDSYELWRKQPLINRQGSLQDQAKNLYEAPFVLVAHGIEADPILCYGNRAALQLWETDLESLLQMPSRLTAEPMHRDERAQLLARTTRDGYVDDYRGIRIARSGRRFEIDQATVWNVVDAARTYVGQAATFSNWKYL